MCTAMTFATDDGYHLFGRNMDIEYDFGQQVVVVPRGFKWINKLDSHTYAMKYAVMGMAVVIENHPLFADGMNEKGLSCAGLNFPGYAQYEQSPNADATNIAPYDLILFLVSQFATVEEVKEVLPTLRLVEQPFLPKLPVPPLHWIVADQSGKSIVIEKTQNGLAVFDNTVGVLSNAPTFDWHITHLRQFMGLQSTLPEHTTWGEQLLTPLGQGLGMHGIPGDFSPPSRFVRTAFLRNHTPLKSNLEQGISEFFHILGNVAMTGGAVITPEGKDDLTTYTCCMNQEKGLYYYTTYNNRQINVIDMYKENLEDETLKIFALKNQQEFIAQN